MSCPMSRAALLAATLMIAAAVADVPAHAASERVRTACTSDYLKFCSQYDPDSFQTVNCMKRVGNKLSRACKTAVQEDGVPSSKQASRRTR